MSSSNTPDPLASIPKFGPADQNSQSELRYKFTLSPEEFAAAVDDAIAGIPADIRAEMDNVAIFIQDQYVPGPNSNPYTVLLGLYEGTPLTERTSWWSAGSLPDRITIYRDTILAICSSRDQVVQQVKVTVVHEIAHHFGISDERLHELGWG